VNGNHFAAQFETENEKVIHMFRHLFFSTRISGHAMSWGVLLMLAGCGVVSSISRPDDPAPTAVPTATFEVIAERSLNPDVNGVPKPVLLRFYELRATAAFERAGFLDLQDKDEAQLGGDFVRRDEFLITPGERRVLERKGNPDVRAFGLFAAYRDLERSTWRATIDSPNSVEMRRRWFGLGPTARLKPVHYVIVVSRDGVRVQLQQETR
jgi:type VI secretion system protein VasD